MSNQSVNGFQGSQPFITDNQYKSLSLEQLRYILNQKKKTIQKSYNELSEKEKLIRDIRRLDKLNEKVKKGIDIKKKYKKKKASKKKKIKTFEEYYEECIKNKKIPKDTPDYFRVALEQAMREHEYKNKENLVKEKSSLEGFANKYIIEGIPGLSSEQYFERINKTLVDFLTYHRNVKFNLLLICMMEKQNIKQKQIIELEEGKAYFHSGTFINFRSTDVDKLISNCWESISARIEAYTEAGSAWYFKEVDRLEIHTTEHNPTKGSSYIDLPKWIKDKKAIINIKNKDNKCFLWCILRYLYPKERDAEWIGDLKKYENSLNTKGITFPISKNDINKFENLNPDLPGRNIFYLDEKECIRPMREIKNKGCKNTIDLFLIEEDGKSHYTLIKNFHRLFRSQKTGSNNGKLFICKRCFWHFSKEELLDKHLEYCSNNKTAVVTMPKPNTYLHFKNYYKQLPVPFVVYADFECFTKPMNSCSPNPKDSYNYNYQKHEPSGFCFCVKGIVPGIHITPITYTKTSEDDNVAKIFILKLEVTKGIYNDFYKRFKPLVMSAKDQKLFNEAKTCHICSLELKDDKVRDHCHFKLYEILNKLSHSMSNPYNKGYIFEVDLEYPEHLWDEHNDYPLAPEKLKVNGVEKLISHFKPRTHYVIHYRTLRQCLELGMKITAVHRGISFYQSPWMEPYIRKNTELRKTAANNFEKDFFKLMNNSVFGKTIENIRKRQNIKIIDDRKKALKLSSRPNFDRCTIFDKHLIALHMLNTEIYFNKPVYVGQAILDLSKMLMFNFHYNYIKKKYHNKAELLFTDTDSLMYQIKTDDFYKDINPDVQDKFNTSDYPSIHPSGIQTGLNKKVIGLFKDEVAGKQITHFVGLRPKLYSYKVEDEKELKKCKGIKKNVVKKKLDFDDYVKCLFSGEKEMRKMKIIRSEKHDIYSKEVNKVALINQDDKRTVLEDCVHTLALR